MFGLFQDKGSFLHSDNGVGFNVGFNEGRPVSLV